MGIFTRRSRQNTASSNVSSLGPNSNNNARANSVERNTPSSTPNSPFIPSSTFGKSGKTTPSSLSPNPSHRPNSRSGSPSFPPSSSTTTANQGSKIELRVAIDPVPIKGINQDAKNLIYVQVSPEEGIAALRREIARTVGHGSMGLFKVSIPQQAFNQSKSYTERFGRSAHLLSQFPAFNLDDPNQLNLSLGPEQIGSIGSSELKIKHWFPEFINSTYQTDHISIIARPLLGMPINHVPLTLRAYFAQPPNSSSSSSGPSCLRSSPPPIVVDINPYITVDELKSELLRAAGKDGDLWKSVVLWQIAMTEGEMNVINDLGRLKNGKMPWPYPPGAMEPIAMSDGNLPVSLFFPKSAPNGDMLNLSIWLNPSCENDSTTSTLPALAREIPHFRYPMNNLTRPASTHCVSPTLSQHQLSPLPLTELPPSVQTAILSSPSTLKVKKSRIRPSTAPAAASLNNDKSAPRSFGSDSNKPPPSSSIRPSTNRPNPNSNQTPRPTSISSTPRGLGIVTPLVTTTSDLVTPSPLLDRTSFSSTVSTESEVSVTSTIPSLNFSQQSLDTATITNVETPQDERSDWLSPSMNETMLKKTASVNKGSLRARLKRVL